MSKVDIKSLADQTQSGAVFSIYLPDVIDRYPELRVVTADMSYIAKLERFKALCPDQFINVGIAEQNMLGICAGLSSEGFKCVALAQATFISMRCFEQVRQYMSYMQYPIILIGLAGGFQLQFMGNTHYALEDLSLMRSIPGIVVMSPADAGEAVNCFEAALGLNRPVYIRFSGGLSNNVYSDDYRFALGRAICLKEGDDICVFATGSMVSSALECARLIESTEDISVRVVDMHTIVPLDATAIRLAKKCKLIVSVEEHHIVGGLGTAIADFVSADCGYPPVLKLGVGDGYSEVGNYDFLLKQHRLQPDMMMGDILKRYRQL